MKTRIKHALVRRLSLGLQRLLRVERQILPRSAAEWQHARVSFSQYAEDLIVKDLLRFNYRGHPGFYVDVGCYDPVHLSNTLAFYRAGWHGLNLDATPASIERFQRARPRDINVCAVVSGRREEMEFLEYPAGATNRLVPLGASDRKSLIGEEPTRATRVSSLPLAELLDRHLPKGVEIDFMDVDVEGFDLEVLQSNDWSRFRPRVLLCESTTEGEREPLLTYCRSQGYRLAARVGITNFLVPEETPA